MLILVSGQHVLFVCVHVYVSVHGINKCSVQNSVRFNNFCINVSVDYGKMLAVFM